MNDITHSRDLASQRGENLPRLVEIMQRLLGEDGCPWDRKQTFESLRKYVLEEAYEVVDAIDKGDRNELREELGDLLLQVVFQSELARREGSFGPNDVIDAISDKLVRRHPHVFGDATVKDADEVVTNWERIKAGEHEKRALLDSVPRSLCALSRAQRMGDKVRRVGFDWPNVDGPAGKVEEEWNELRQAMEQGDRGEVEQELGDMLFALVNLARHLGVDAEMALRKANDKFEQRFGYIERAISKEYGSLQAWYEKHGKARDALQVLDRLWERAKDEQRGESEK